MSETAEPYYSLVVRKRQEPLSFSSAEQLQAWVERQESSWKPIFDIEKAQLPNAMRSAFDTFRNQLRSVFKVARQYASNPTPELKNSLDSGLRDVFGKAERRVA